MSNLMVPFYFELSESFKNKKWAMLDGVGTEIMFKNVVDSSVNGK